jgi:tyrosyl-tRNA synthetase
MNTSFLRNTQQHVGFEALPTDRPWRVKLGMDPTAPDLHLGHAVLLRKMREFQDAGHEGILVVGSFTAQIGDPTDKLAARVVLTPEQIAENLKQYKVQASKLISFEGDNAAEIKFNSEWLGAMNFADVLKLASTTTVQRMLERDMFQKRIEEEKPIYIHELMYPLMQGYDSVALMVDGEIGGNDQMFNMLAGRDMLKEYKKDKFVMTVKLLTDPTGKKMGKSEGNMITLADTADDMFGKVMSWTDGMVIGGFELCTNVSQQEILDMEVGMQNNENPMNYKKRLAREIITMYHTESEANDAQKNWEKTFSEGGVPDVITELTPQPGETLVDILTKSKQVSSKTEFRRLVKEGAIKIMMQGNEEEKITNDQFIVNETNIFKIGKKKFIKIVIKY